MLPILFALAVQAPVEAPPHLVVTANLSGVEACPYAFAANDADAEGSWTLSKPDGDQSGQFCTVNSGLGWGPESWNTGRFTIIVQGVHTSGAIERVPVEIDVPEEGP